MDESGALKSPLLRIDAMLSELGYSERKFAEYVLENPRETIDSTIDQLARESGSSYASISRFCRRMNYSGFKEFKRALVDDIVTQKSHVERFEGGTVDAASSTAEIVEAVAHSIKTTLSETKRVIDPPSVERAAGLLRDSTSVLIVGAGTSGITARYAFTRLFRLGIPCSNELDAVLYTMQASALKKGETLLAVSSSGRTESVVRAAEAARERGAAVISIGDYAISPLNRIADIALFTTSRNVRIFEEMELPLLAGQLLIVDLLFATIHARSGKEATTIYSRTKAIADRMKR